MTKRITGAILLAGLIAGCGEPARPYDVVESVVREQPATTARPAARPPVTRPITTTTTEVDTCLEDYISLMGEYRRFGGSDASDGVLRAYQGKLRSHYDQCGGAAVLGQIEVIENWIWLRGR